MIRSFQTDRFRRVLEDIKVCKERLHGYLDQEQISDGHDLRLAQSFIHILRVFEAEYLCELKEWKQILKTIGVPHCHSFDHYFLMAVFLGRGQIATFGCGHF